MLGRHAFHFGQLASPASVSRSNKILQRCVPKRSWKEVDLAFRYIGRKRARKRRPSQWSCRASNLEWVTSRLGSYIVMHPMADTSPPHPFATIAGGDSNLHVSRCRASYRGK